MLKLKYLTGMIFVTILTLAAFILLWGYLYAMVWGPYLLSSVSWNA